MNERLNNQCPRCGQSQLKSWSELREEEREIVRRLPAAADYSAAERQTNHRWCPRCWHEAREDQVLT